jgi:hypothetical protein
MAKNTRKAATADTETVHDGDAGRAAKDFAARADERRVEAAEAETQRAEEEGRTPANTAGANPAPGRTMNPASGAFVEPAVIDAVPAEHPSVENNPRRGTSSVQNGADFNDPHHLDPKDPEFSGEGLDLSVYGAAPPKG